MYLGPPVLRRPDDEGPNGWSGGLGDYVVDLDLDAERITVFRLSDRTEVFNQVRGVPEISTLALVREDDPGSVLSLKEGRTSAGHKVIWIYDGTDDNYGVGLDLTTRELTEWGQVP